MSTTTPLTDSINALTTYANEVTGGSDTTLSDAVATLASGYGSGGDTLSQWVTNTLTSWENTDVTTIDRPCLSNGGDTLNLISLPNLETISVGSAFSNTKAKAFNLPKLKSPNSACFINCTNVETLVLPSWVGGWINDNIFLNCTSLSSVDFGENTEFFGRYAVFSGCSILETIIIRASAVVPLTSTGSFTNTPFASGGTGGTIYVPSALISEYQSASNWSTVHGYGTITWKAIEGSIYETQYADGTAITA